MAERRMFAKSIILSARFLRMPSTSRLLYYDLGMSADDDGVVEAFTVMRTTGATEDDLRVLVSKGFIQILNEDLVSFITDWKQNNYIRPDRYTPSSYNELLVKLSGDRMPTVGIPSGIPSIGKDSIGKVSIDNKAAKPPRAPRFTPPSVEEVATYCRERGNNVDAQRFVDFYAAKGWKVGNQAMKDWKAAVRTWERRDGQKSIRTPDKYAYREGESL